MEEREVGVTLGRLEAVALRHAWANEAHDFTPWLARPDNLSLLSHTLGLELEVEGRETAVGPFRADILCKDATSARWVLIENQLERTDHSHLGQLLTYAAGLDAVVIVWVAARFSDEHRAALDWLNRITEDDVLFFGVEVELWRIGDSAVAPKFNVVAEPNEWSRQVASAAREAAASELGEAYLAYWSAFHELVEERSGVLRPRRAKAERMSQFSVGRTGVTLGVSLLPPSTLDATELSVWLYLSGDAQPLFYELQRDAHGIEASVGASLVWNEHPNRKSSEIDLRSSIEGIRDPARWPEQHAWALEKLEAFHTAFVPRL